MQFRYRVSLPKNLTYREWIVLDYDQAVAMAYDLEKSFNCVKVEEIRFRFIDGHQIINTVYETYGDGKL